MKIVSNDTLVCKIDEWNFMQYMIAGKCDITNQVADQEKVKADLFEAILGAVPVASQWNPKAADNAVSTLKELAEQGYCSSPIYEYGSPENLGYDENGNPHWVCSCKVAEWALIRQV